MKLWKLRPVTGDEEGGAWSPWYDKSFGFIVAAHNEEGARLLASKERGNEGEAAWLDQEQTECDCIALRTSEPQGVVMRDFHAA